MKNFRSLKYAALLSLGIFTASAFAQNAAVVNGKPIPSARVNSVVQQMVSQGQTDTPELRKAIKDQLVDNEILLQEALKAGVADSSDVKEQLEASRQAVIIRALVKNFLDKNPVSDQEAQEEYKRFKAQTSDREYHLRHVLVETEAEAKEIISKLQAGTKFETLASRSKDKASAANGGDLGWSAPETFVKPFADAAVALTKGAYTRTPVKTQFGYHVIKLEDVRAAKVPAFEEMKPQIVQFLQRKKLQDYQSQLKQKARIE